MGNSKRLLLVVTQAEWGGVQSYIARCAAEAQRRGVEVLVAAGGEGELESRCQRNNIPYRKLSKLTRELSVTKDTGAVRELAALMREWRPEAVYLHSSKAGVVGSVAARLARVPRVIYRIGGWSFLDPVSPLQKAMRLWSEKLTARFKDVIITVHPGDQALAERVHIRPRERLVTIANGLDLTSFDQQLVPRDDARDLLRGLWREGIPSRTSMPDASQLVVTIANFYPTKNLLGYLDAIALVRERLPQVHFMILGDGEQREALEQKRRALGLEGLVSFPGMRTDAANLLTGADLFVLPSLKEGMPWTVLEAMASALPCVVTDVGADRWMLGDAGVVVPPGRANLLADAIVLRLQDNAGSAALGQAARRTVERRFTDQAMWDATFQTINKT